MENEEDTNIHSDKAQHVNESKLPEIAAVDYVGQSEYIDSLSSVDAYKKKIGEFTAAISERDGYINQLEIKLQECISQRDNLAKDAETQSNQFTKEIEVLREQLKESIILLERQNKTGVNLVEHIELKNKLIHLQQDRSEEKKAFDTLSQQLKVKTEAIKDIEVKYKLLIKMHKEVKEKQYLEAAQKEATLTKNHEDELKRIRKEHQRQMEIKEEKHIAWVEEERERHRKEVNQWREEMAEIKKKNSLLLERMKEEMIKGEKEIGSLRLQLEEATEEISRISAADESLLKENEAKIENLRKEMSEKHQSDLEDLKTKYKSEVAVVAQHIDQLERSQEEEQMEIMKNLQEIQQEGLRYRTLLEEEREKCKGVSVQLEKSKQRCLSLESELSLLNCELDKSKSVFEDVDQLTKEKFMLQGKIVELDAEVQRLLADQRVRNDELVKIKQDYEREKEMKNETNLKVQELNVKSESLVKKLQEKEADLEAALNIKKKLEKEVLDFKIRVKDLEEESQALAAFRKEAALKVDLERQVSRLTEEVHTLTSSLANLEQYKLECHNIKERIMNLVKVLRNELPQDIEVMRDFTDDAEVSDHVSLLEAHVTSITTWLEEKSLTTELHTIREQSNLSKEELDKLGSQESGGEDLLRLSNDQSSKGQLSSLASPVEDDQNERSFITNKQNENGKAYSIGCQTSSVPTQEQGFQTSVVASSPDGVFASKTIEEDYVMEEIFIVPITKFAMKGSISLKNLKEIGVTSDEATSGPTSLSSGNEGTTSLTRADYENLKVKFHESQFIIKSLKNENFYLKRALQFKSIATDGDKDHPGSTEGVEDTNCFQEPVSSDTDVNGNRAIKSDTRETSSQTDPSFVTVFDSEGTADLRNNLLDVMAEKLDLLEKAKSHLQKIEFLKKEISRLHKCRHDRDEEKPTVKEGWRKSFYSKPAPPLKKWPKKASAGHRASKKSASQGAAKQKVRSLSECSDEISEGDRSGYQVLDGMPEARKMPQIASDAEVDEEKRDIEGFDSTSELDLFHRNIWETKLRIQMQINEALKEELKNTIVPESKTTEDAMSEEWMQHLRTALMLFIDCRCPGFRRKAEWVVNMVEGWNRALHGGSEMDEPGVDERKRQKEVLAGEREEHEAPFASILEDLKTVVMEQKEVQKAIKELENNLICQMDSNLEHCREELGNTNGSEVFGLAQFNSIGAIHSVDFGGSDLVAFGDAETDFLREFEDITSAIVTRSQEEKIELLQSQRIMMLKILEGNRSKISDICRSHFRKLRNASVEDRSPPVDAENELATVAEEIESSLSEEANWMEKEYEELLRQYSHEQSLHSHSHSLTLREFRQRINSLLQHAKCQPSLNNIEMWKPLLSLLSQVTLNLLHYYTVSQKFANNGGDSELMPDAFPGASRLPGMPYSSTGPPDDESEGENSLRISFPDEGNMNALDTTGNSEGILEDLDRSEQVKGMLTTSYPHLIKALKGSYDQVSLPALEREVQELVISLQAAAGMLRVFMLSKGELGSSAASASSSRTITAESGVITSFDLQQEEKYPSLQQETIYRQDLSEPHPEIGKYISDTNSHSTNDIPSALNSPSLSDYTLLKPVRMEDSQQLIEDLKEKLSEAKKEREHLLTQLHQTQGLYSGQLDEKKTMAVECAKREERIESLLRELQNTKTLLADAERRLKDVESSTTKKNKKKMDKNIKDKVKAVLAAKDRQSLGQEELSERVRDLENILEEVVTERDKSLEDLNLKITDLTQQLEVADRQLRSSRQFLEEQATERDLEIEELVRVNEKLKEQLKEKEAIVTQHSGLQKEMRMLEKELREKYASLGEERAKREGKQNELAAALDKVKDLREVLQSVEAQLATKCSEARSLQEQNHGLTQDLDEVRNQNLQLHSQLENALKQSTLTSPPVPPKSPIPSPFDFGDPRKDASVCKQPPERQISLSEELENTNHAWDEEQRQEEAQRVATSLSQATQNLDLSYNASLLENLIVRLERSTQGLETLQITLVSGGSLSDEELSVRERLEMSAGDVTNQDKTRSLSPASLEAKLEEKLLSFERSAEAAAKYTKDLEMRLGDLKAEFDEMACERDELHQQLSALSSLKSELEKASEEFDILRRDYERNVLSLKEELEQSKERERGLQRQLRDIESEFETRWRTAERGFVEGLEKMKAEKQQLEMDKNGLENAVGELNQEREMLRRQNSEHLIKISGLEARLEEFRRGADSSYELELRLRIATLQDELEKSRVELTSKVREVEDLRYSVKELHEKLVLREEELDRMNQAPDEQPVSLPQSFKDQNRHRIQALEEEIQRQRSVNEEQKEKLQSFERGGDSTSASNALLECLLDEKNTRIRELLQQKEALVEGMQAGLVRIDEGQSLEEVAKPLRRCLTTQDWALSVERRSSNCPEVQRRAPDQSDERVHDPGNELKSSVEETGVSSVLSTSPNNRPLSSLDSFRGSLSMESLVPSHARDHNEKRSSQAGNFVPAGARNAVNPRRDLFSMDLTGEVDDRSEFDNLAVENAMLKDQILILEQEVKGLTDYQKKLEEDFNAAQEMLEAKEEEIQAMTEEVEDHLPVPHTTSICSVTEERLNELMLENQTIEERCRELETKIRTQEAALDEAQKTEKKLEELKQNFEEESKRSEELVRDRDSVEQRVFLLERQLMEGEARCERLRQDLSVRSQEVEDLSAQLDRVLTQFKDSNTRHEKRIKTLEKEHFREMQDMKEKSIDREKQLCNEYEERMSAQVNDLALKLSREKEESLKNFKEHYEALLTKARQESLKQKRERGSSSLSQDGHRSSSEELQKDLQRELEASAALDQSLLCYLDGNTGSGASRESSVLSEGGSAPPTKEGHSNALMIQNLMRKLHKEGIQVLTLSEFLFLQNHHNVAAAVVGQDPSSGDEQKLKEYSPESYETQDQASSIDIEPSQMRKKIELLRFSLTQEKNLNQELQDVLNREKQEVDGLRKQLESERTRQFEVTSEMVRVKCQGQLMDKELRLAHEEIRELRERIDISEKQIQELEEALNSERNNFNDVSTTLNHQRKLAASSTDHQSQIIKELRNCLEKERTRVLALVSEVHDLKSSRNQLLSLEDTIKSGVDRHSSFFVDKEIQLAMSVDKERELQREVSELQVSLQTLTEEKAYERERHLKEFREVQLQVDQLRNALIKLESKKNAIETESEGKNKLIRELELNVKRLQEEIGDLHEDLLRKEKRSSPDGDLTVPKTRGHARVEENGGVGTLCKDELHALNFSKLKQKDAEIAYLKRKLSQFETELRLFEEKERAMLMDPQRGVGPHSPHGPHVVPRIKNLPDFLEIQQQENIELCKSLAHLTDDRRLLRQRILRLEGVVDELNMLLVNQEKYLLQKNLNDKNIYCAEKAALAAETSNLKLALAELDGKKQELEQMVLELQKSLENQAEVALKRENLSSRYLCWKYTRSESYRKALVWQKEYLLHLLKGYQATEKRAIERLTTMARNVVRTEETGRANGHSHEHETSHLSPKSKFKSSVLVVIALQRMKILMRRWQLKSKLKNFIKPTLASADLASESPSPVANPQQPSSDIREDAASVTQAPSTSKAPSFQISGLTPPTKESAQAKRTVPLVAPSPQSRNLFDTRKDETDLNECIHRLDYIHSQLGLPKTPS